MGERVSSFLRRGICALIGVPGLLLCSCQSAQPQPVAQVEERRSEASTILSADTFDIAQLQDKFEAIARDVAPSVVAISASVVSIDSPDVARSDEMNGEKLAALLNRTTRLVGTGFVIDPDGLILTNDHVVAEGEQLWVTTDDKKVYPAMVVGSDPRTDLAVLKIPASNLRPASFADGGKVSRGQWTIALGNPYGLAADGNMAMSVGIVSATGRALPRLADRENRIYSNLIQTTAQINPGNSGGPLFDIHGQVIGINTAVILPQKSTNGIGFAIPTDARFVRLVKDLAQGREVAYGYLGVMAATPTTLERRSAGVGRLVGARIDRVEGDSPAAGVMKPDDIVTYVDGQIVDDGDHFVRLVGSSPTDRPVRFTVVRDGGRTIDLGITLRKREIASAITKQNQRLRWQGMVVGPIPANWNFGHASPPPSGLMVFGIDSQSPLLKFGIAQGCIITAVAGQPVSEVTDLQKILNDTPADRCEVKIVNPSNAVLAAEH